MNSYPSDVRETSGETLPAKPAGSVIKDSVDAEGVTLSWPLPSSGFYRYPAAAFIAFWLCGWAVGWVAVAGQIVGGAAEAFLLFWLGGWTLGGVFAMYMLWTLLRPARPESVRLEAERLRYDPGRSLYTSWQKYYARTHWYWVQPIVSVPRRPVEIARADIAKFVLERVGERQRLCFDRGADRLEIGAALREPEREWLYTVLQKWHPSS